MILGDLPRGAPVPPLRRVDIRQIATATRTELGLQKPYVDMWRLLELDLADRGVVYDIGSGDEMGDDEAQSFPDSRVIRIREDIYEAMIQNDRRARFTVCHEIGHLALHRGVPLRWSKGKPKHHYYEDSEWQADTFAAEFLMPADMVQKFCRNAVEVAELFVVSLDAALIRVSVLRAEGLFRR